MIKLHSLLENVFNAIIVYSSRLVHQNYLSTLYPRLSFTDHLKTLLILYFFTHQHLLFSLRKYLSYELGGLILNDCTEVSHTPFQHAVILTKVNRNNLLGSVELKELGILEKNQSQ